jgi:hypothetical protein
MKKTVNVLGWVFVLITMLTLIFTVLSTYLFGRQYTYFNSYNALQVCLVITMITWAIKMSIDKKERPENIKYSILCTLIAVGAILFFYLGVA